MNYPAASCEVSKTETTISLFPGLTGESRTKELDSASLQKDGGQALQKNGGQASAE